MGRSSQSTFPRVAACVLLCTILTASEVVAATDPGPAPTLYNYGFSPGERVPNLDVVDVEGRSARLHSLSGRLGTVLITWDRECPVSARYLPRILELATKYGPKGYNFVLVDVTPHSIGEARSDARKHEGVSTLFDNARTLATGLRAASTAESFLVDSRGTLKYRGAIDDQYGISHQRASVGSAWLRVAMERVAAGEDPLIGRTEASGCALDSGNGLPARTLPVTYHNRISRIIQSNCQTCHRVGGLGPMPLESYPQVVARRAVIEFMVGGDRMPPWSAQHDVGEWANDRSLSPRDKSDLLNWLKNGAPEGDRRDAPISRRFSSAWNIGKPDAILRIPKPITVPAQGVIAYKYVYTQTHFDEDKWITAVEIRPTQPKVVHHVIALIEEPGRRALTPRERAALRPGESPPAEPQDSALGFFAITVPGSLGIKYPEGTGKRLPKGAWLKFEIHYQPNGEQVTDRTEIGFKFSKKPLHEVESRSAPNADFVIPPNNPHFEVKASYDFREAGRILSLFPHMHLRGAAFRYDLRLPDGRTVELLSVPRFDFNWQSYYEFRSPVEVPAGSKLLATGWYDNSRNNPWNPDPSKEVRWGPQTYEEMMIGYFDFVAEPKN
jgi:AhpC/TSA family